MALLDVKGLKTHFFTQDGVVKAVDGVSFHVDEGETLGIVGESGCCKSVSVLSVMRLVPQPPGKIVAGEVAFDGRNLLELSDDEMRRVRGNKVAMIFQDPMTSLNPVLTIGRQITEALELHMGMNKDEARQRSAELPSLVGMAGTRGRFHRDTQPTASWSYAGHVVEEAPVNDLYKDPHHPYTIGLLVSLPRLDEVREERLTSIDGLPPDVIDPPPGCRFEPRCPYALEKCQSERPELELVAPKHRAACWVDVSHLHPNA